MELTIRINFIWCFDYEEETHNLKGDLQLEDKAALKMIVTHNNKQNVNNKKMKMTILLQNVKNSKARI